MKIGLSVLATSYTVDIAEVAKRAEELGFDSLWLPEHPVFPVQTRSTRPGRDGPLPAWMADQIDPFVALARASAVTRSLKLGTGVCLVPERNPLLLAKEVATLDMCSSGRFLFGIGAGWLREESEIMGADFPHRWSQTRESVMAMKELWTKPEAEFHGRFYDFPPVRSAPRPVQRPHPPVLIGSRAPKVFERVVDWADGWIPNRITPEQVEEGRRALDDLAKKASREPSSIEVTVYGQRADVDDLRGFVDAGADRIVVPGDPWVGRSDDVDALADLDRIAEAVGVFLG